MRYVLSTFVVIPMRWIDRFGWRPMCETERVASANYYRELGRHMNIKDAPATHHEFAAHLDAYEREHFAYSPGGRAVSDATLELLVGFYPRPLRPLLRRSTLALLDPPLRDAFRYPDPGGIDTCAHRRRPPRPRRDRAPHAAAPPAALHPRAAPVRDLSARIHGRSARHVPRQRLVMAACEDGGQRAKSMSTSTSRGLRVHRMSMRARRLDGKVLMVTGATRGIGLATAERLGAFASTRSSPATRGGYLRPPRERWNLQAQPEDSTGRCRGGLQTGRDSAANSSGVGIVTGWGAGWVILSGLPNGSRRPQSMP